MSLTMGRILKWTGIGIVGLLGLAVIAAVASILIGTLLFDHRARATVPAGLARNSSLYVTSADGTKIAIDVWLPETLNPGQRVPALIKATPYWRAQQLTWIGKALATFLAPDFVIEPDVEILNRRGYAVVVVEARGTGASFGTLKIMFSDAEVNDYSSIADWIAKQPWSSGKIGAYGFSYRGISAANMASLSNPHIRAVAPLFDLTDLYLLGYPGGTFAQYLLTEWGAQTRELNDGLVPCQGDPVCEIAIEGPKPVDSDSDGSMLRAASAAHAANYDVRGCARAATARDDKICTSGLSFSDTSLIARKVRVEARHLPFFALTGWLDESSPAQVLYRFKTFSNPQQVVLGPFTHGGFQGDDPFGRPLDMPYAKQTTLMADFFDRYLREGPARPIHSSVHYYVLGGGMWRTSPSWPPANSTMEKWYPDIGHSLTNAAPVAGSDAYNVDFTATTGALSGYRGQVDLSKTDYGDRAKQDSRLLTYTSAPMANDAEIAGDPVAHLRLSSSSSAALVIIYLEDVSPSGRVTYITQGLLNLAHRKLAPLGENESADPLHSYLRKDMALMTPGLIEDVTIAISPIAALIRKGHRLRIAIAGADGDNLERLPARGAETLTLARGEGSYVEVPVAH
jgi:putative CocE/NonD family hydrolase